MSFRPLHALIAVDKPTHMSSHDLVRRVRKATGQKRVGHAGTLDPLASGVLVIGIGQATRLLGFLTLDRKSYEAAIRFGQARDTDDAEGRVIFEAPCDERLSDTFFATTYLSSLVGTQMQLPPTYSAISQEGTRAYRRARRGEVVELDPREVEIYTSKLLSLEESDKPLWRCLFSVSKGCYIRAIARDMGRELGCGAHIEGLRRRASGTIGLTDCVSLEELESDAVGCVQRAALDPVRVLGFPTLMLKGTELDDLKHGRSLANRSAFPDGTLISMLSAEGLCGIWEAQGNRLRTKSNFAEVIGRASA